MTEYLRQLKTGRIYIKRPGIAVRTDMVPFDPDKARRRIEANRQIIEDAKKAQTPEEIAAHSKETSEAIALAQTLTESEKAISDMHEQNFNPDLGSSETMGSKSPADLELERRAAVLEADDEIQAIKAMKTAGDVANYIRREYGEKADARSEDVEALKDKALNLRAKRIFEAD